MCTIIVKSTWGKTFCICHRITIQGPPDQLGRHRILVVKNEANDNEVYDLESVF